MLPETTKEGLVDPSPSAQADTTEHPTPNVTPPQWDWKPLTPAELLAELRRQYPDARRAQAQNALDAAVKSEFDSLTNRWTSEMESLLFYAGIFSAVLTAFNVESYKLLRPNSMDDTVLALRQLSQQLNSFSVGHPFVNATHQVNLEGHTAATTSTTFLVPSSIVSINALWFSSLVLSLASASLALLVKQWISEITSGIPNASREGAQLRQDRLDSLRTWHMSAIVKCIPILLQIALILFLTGLVLLLWSLQPIVAAATSALTGILFFFLIMITVLPIFRWHCCYRSPQSYVAYTCLLPLRNLLVQLLQRIARGCAGFLLPLSKDGSRYLRPLWSKLLYFSQQLGRPLPYTSWETQELRRLVNPVYHTSLNISTAIRACDAMLDPAYLDNMRAALSCEPNAPLARCLSSLGMVVDRTLMEISPAKTLKARLLIRDSPKSVSQVVHVALRQMLTIEKDKRDPDDWEDGVAGLMGFLAYATNDGYDSWLPYNAAVLKTYTQVAMESRSVGNRYKALEYLAVAVQANIDSPESCKSWIICHVLSATIQWVEKIETEEKVISSDRAPPHLKMLAVTIIAQCLLCFVAVNPEVPQERKTWVGALRNRAWVELNAIPIKLSGLRDALARNRRSRCEEFAFGLQLLLKPLTSLSEFVDTTTSHLVDDLVVSALESSWNAAWAVLEPEAAADASHEATDTAGLEEGAGVTERLLVLQRKVASFYNNRERLELKVS